jgi:hypothetical protein
MDRLTRLSASPTADGSDGTAFDITGTNAADPGSMEAAIRLACQCAARSTAAPSIPQPVPVPEPQRLGL